MFDKYDDDDDDDNKNSKSEYATHFLRWGGYIPAKCTAAMSEKQSSWENRPLIGLSQNMFLRCEKLFKHFFVDLREIPFKEFYSRKTQNTADNFA